MIYSRETLIKMLIENDPNGCYSDHDSLIEFDRVASHDELMECAIDQELITQ